MGQIGSPSEGLVTVAQGSSPGDGHRARNELAEAAALAAHELRSPLQVMMGFATLLQRAYGSQLDDKGQDMVRRILKGAARQEALITDLLAYAQVVADSGDVGPVDLGAAMREVGGALAAHVADTGASLTWGRLPTVIGDRERLKQVLCNLIVNAFTFVTDETVPRVHVSAAPLEDRWLVSVADNGIGIHADDRARIFDLFVRLNPRDRFDTSGVGLTVCRQVVEASGGRIWVEAGQAVGSVFHFTVAGDRSTQVEVSKR